MVTQAMSAEDADVINATEKFELGVRFLRIRYHICESASGFSRYKSTEPDRMQSEQVIDAQSLDVVIHPRYSRYAIVSVRPCLGTVMAATTTFPNSLCCG